MKSYLLHAPPAPTEDSQRLAERAIVVQDGFSWVAFLAPVLWFLYHRCWLAALVMLAATLAVCLLGWFALAPPAYALLVLVAAHAYAGLEAGVIRARSLSRRGRPLVDVVVARNAGEAEHALIERLSGSTLSPGAQVSNAASVSGRPPDGGVVGLFPEPEVRR